MKKIKEKKKFQLPTAFTILFFIITFFVILSWILKWSGVSYEVNKESYNVQALGILDIFYSIIQGFLSKAEIIIFILVLGGFINVVLETKALEAFTQSVSKKLGNKAIWLIPILMLFFSFCGSTYGMAEESLGFYLIIIPLILSSGYDKFTGLLIVLFGAGAGVISSTVNPFVIAAATDATGGKISSGEGMAWRWISWIFITLFAILYVMWYAIRTKKNPNKSVTFSTLQEDKVFFLGESVEEIKFNKRRIATLIVFLITFIIMVLYLVAWDSILGGNKFESAGKWMNKNIPYLTALIPGFGMGYLPEVALFFFVSSLIIGAINWKGEKNYVEQIIVGTKDMLGVCLVIATAAGVGVVMKKSGIEILFVNGLSSVMKNMNKTLFILISFILFLPLSFLIPSTSGFAAAIFPIWGPLAITIGAGSGSVLAFSFASGVINLFTPTSGVVMGALGIAKIDYASFLKEVWKFILAITLICCLLLIIGSFMSSNIF
ncbi:YfcC family protein [Spiroplasma endosymbiont of Atherix ibis]|uniref:YfcC family protein n=1 Tax=Spiroplasma endosymbiont of Atherix ibis TaxID=3066291 RepID=UPI0030D1FF92